MTASPTTNRRALPALLLRLPPVLALALLLPQPAALAQVTLTNSDPFGVSSFNSGANWDDGNPPSPGNNYFTFIYGLRSPDAIGNFTFLGDSLTIQSGGSLGMKTTGTITVDNLILAGGTVSQSLGPGGGVPEVILAGNIDLQSTSTLSAPGSPRHLTITAPISGGGAGVELLVRASGTNNVITLAGDNSFAGTVGVDNTGGGGISQLSLAHSNALGNASLVTVENTTGATSGTGTRLNLEGGITVDNDLLLRSSPGNLRTSLYNNSGDNTWNGDISLDGPSLNQFWIGSGTMTINGNVTSLPSHSDLLFIRGGGSGFINGTIDLGTNDLGKTDDGVWQINSSGNNWNNTQLSRGTLRLGTDNALPVTASLILGQGTDTSPAALDLNGFDQTIPNISTVTTAGGNKQVTNTSATPATLTINLAGNTTYAGLLNGNLSLVKDGPGNLTLSASNNFTGEVLVANTSGGGTSQLTLANSNALGNASLITVENTNGDISGTGTRLNLQGNITVNNDLLLRSSPGNLRTSLYNNSGSNTWNGDISLDGPSLNQFWIGSGSMTINGNVTSLPTHSALLFLRGAGSGVINGTIDLGSNNLGKTDDGVWQINSSGNTWNDTQLARGTLRLGAENALPVTTGLLIGQGSDPMPAVLDLNGFNQTVASLSTVTTAGGNKEVTNTSATPATLTVNQGGSTTYGGLLNGNLSLVKDGPGTLTLSGAGNMTGEVLVANTSGGGTSQLTLANSNALGNASLVTVENTTGATGGTGTRLNLQGNITVDNDLLLNSGPGGRRVALYNNSGSNTWNGDIRLDGPSLTQFWVNAGTMTINGNITSEPNHSELLFIRGDGTGFINGTIDLGSNNLGKTENGVWQINTTGNTWNNTQLARGTIRLGIDNALPVTTGVILGQGNDGNLAVLDLNGFDQTIASLTANFTGGNNKRVTNLNGGQTSTFTLNQSANTTLQQGIFIDGNLNFVKDGPGELRIRGNNLGYTGETIIHNGRLFLGGDGAPSATSQLPAGTVVTVASGANLRINGLGGSGANNEIIGGLQGGGLVDTSNGGTIARLTIDNQDDYHFSGSFNANPQLHLIKDGPGIQTFSGNSSFTGDATVEGGSWNITGSVNRTGAANPIVVLSDGTLSGSGSITSHVNINGGTLAPGDATLMGLGTMTLTGDLQFASDWQVSMLGTDVSLLDHSGSFNGTLDDIELTAGPLFSPATLTPLQIYQGTGPLDGLFNNFGPGTLPGGLYSDADGVAEIGGYLFAAYINQTLDGQGNLVSGSGIVLFAVPEPGRAMLLAIAALGLLVRRRR